MGFALVLFTGLFMFDNQEFFKTAEEQYNDGYRWEYVGKQPVGDVPSLPVIEPKSGNEVIYYRLTK